MQLTRILAIRHGETEWNADGRIQGHLDIGLNAVGEQQAHRLAMVLAAQETIDHIYSSCLRRAAQTAQEIATATRAPITYVKGLRERCFGNLQGQTFAEVTAKQPEVAECWRRRLPEWTPPGAGGESLRVFQARVVEQASALARANLGRTIALVTHGGVLDVMYRCATRLGLQDARTWKIANTSINRLLWTPDSGFSLIGWADTTHLENLSLDETVT